jgi:hypothetical protein
MDVAGRTGAAHFLLLRKESSQVVVTHKLAARAVLARTNRRLQCFRSGTGTFHGLATCTKQ